MQFSKWTMGVGMLLGTLLPVSAEAQVVKNDKLLSFEDPQIPVFISGTDSRLEISDEHYKDGLHSLSWTFNPGAVLSIKKDLKFEKKTLPEKIPIFPLSLYGCTMSKHRTRK